MHVLYVDTYMCVHVQNKDLYIFEEKFSKKFKEFSRLYLKHIL